jgi:small subunit ribosomal protein S1
MTETKNEMGNPDFDLLYSNDIVKDKTTKEYQELSALYESTITEMPKAGQVVNGEYQGVSYEQYVFSVSGFKDDVRIDVKPSESKYLRDTEVGTFIDIIILNVNHDDFFIRGSIESLYESMAHVTLKSLNDGESVQAYVKSLNPAGYDIELIHGGVVLPAFMPNTLAGINKLHDPTSIIGETFEVMIESYDERKVTYIVSRRKYLHSLIPSAVKELVFDEPYMGTVTGTEPFGVFVEFNECLTGMIHKANIHPDWTNRISEIDDGFQIEFYVKEIIKNSKFPKSPKIILTQILRETLWDTIKNGQVIEGKIKDVKQFGTLVNLDEETVGLIHTSEMDKLKKSFTKGDDVRVEVLSVDRQSRKIFLTLD